MSVGGLRYFDKPAADVGLKLLLSHERGLILRASHLNAKHFARETKVCLVVVAQEQERGLLATLETLNNLLRSVGNRIGGAAAWVHNLNPGLALRSRQENIRLKVPEIMQVAPARPVEFVLHDLADIQAFALSVPALVVIARDKMRSDTLALRVVARRNLALRRQAGSAGNKVKLVKATLSVNQVSAVIDVPDTFRREQVIERIQNVKARVLRPQVRVRHRSEPVNLARNPRRVNLEQPARSHIAKDFRPPVFRDFAIKPALF